MQQFDPNIPNLMTGAITTAVVIDPANTFPPFEVGNHVLDENDSFEVQVEWEVQGLLAPLWLSALQSADWDVAVYAESMAQGQEILLGREAVTVDPTQLSYSTTINVAGGQLDGHAPGGDTSGVYKLVVVVFLDSTLGGPGYDITGFHEGPFIQVESPI